MKRFIRFIEGVRRHVCIIVLQDTTPEQGCAGFFRILRWSAEEPAPEVMASYGYPLKEGIIAPNEAHARNLYSGLLEGARVQAILYAERLAQDERSAWDFRKRIEEEARRAGSEG